MGLVYSLQFSDMLFAGWNRHTDSYYCVKIHEMSEILEKSLALFARKFCARPSHVKFGQKSIIFLQKNLKPRRHPFFLM